MFSSVELPICVSLKTASLPPPPPLSRHVPSCSPSVSPPTAGDAATATLRSEATTAAGNAALSPAAVVEHQLLAVSANVNFSNNNNVIELAAAPSSASATSSSARSFSSSDEDALIHGPATSLTRMTAKTVQTPNLARMMILVMVNLT